MESLEDLKLYLRVDNVEEDNLILALQSAAINYINQMTGKTTTKDLALIAGDDLYRLCVRLMVAHWYENRGIISPTQTNKISHTVDALITHIAVSGEYL